MHNGLELVKKAVYKVFKKLAKIPLTILAIIIVVIIIVLMVLGVFQTKKDDAKFEEGSWKSVPYGASQYTSNVDIDTNGNITSSMSAQEVWDTLIDNGGRVDEYLDGPEELLKLMNAEVVTNYPDTRPNPDEEIDWDKLNKDVNSKKVQGIIKFRRAKSDGSISTMTYVDPTTFNGWIEQYNETGDESIKNKVLEHFTIEKNLSFDYNGGNLDYSTNDLVTNISNAIVAAAKTTPSPGAGWCEAWAETVYRNAGLEVPYYPTAYEAYKACVISKDTTNIPVGAAVFGTGSGSYAGHVGIYIGNGLVMDNVGAITTSTLSEWIGWQSNRSTVLNEQPGWLGWGWLCEEPSQIISGGNNSSNSGSSNNSGASTQTSLNNVLFIGDSITVGLQNSGLIPNATFYAEVSTTPADWLSRVSSLPQNSNNISSVCVMLGVNGTNQTSQMKQLIDALSARYSGKTIYVQKVLPVASTYTYINYQTMNNNIQAYNNEIQSYCNSKSNVKFIDTSSGYVDSSGAAKAELFDGEGLHPTNYQILKNNIESAITGSSGTNKDANEISKSDMQLITTDGKVTFYNGDGSAMEGGSLNALGYALSDGQVAMKNLSQYKNSVIYIETATSGEGSYANGKFFYVTDTGGGLADNQVDVYAKVDQATLNAAPYGSFNSGAKIYLVQKDVSYEDYQAKYLGKTLSQLSGSEETSFVVKVATWSQTDDIIEYTDPEFADSHFTRYTMSTQTINYQEFVKGYTMPFDYLWSLTVMGDDQGIALDLADLVLDSTIEITVHDNLTVTTNVDVEEYQKDITVTEGNTTRTETVTYTTTHTTITRSNTLKIALTRADVWIVDYKQEFTYQANGESNTYVEKPVDMEEKIMAV